MSWLLYLKDHGINALSALAILLLGFIALHFCQRWLQKQATQKLKDPTVHLFALNASYALIMIVIIISALGRLGVPTASLLTVLGASGLAIALSLKDSLTHVANGLILIGLKIFHIGDIVEVNGVTGVVDKVNLLTTSLRTIDGDRIVMPNSKVLSDKIRTIGYKGQRRIDLTISVSYDADITLAKSLVLDILQKHELILETPAPSVAVKELADSAVLLAVRPFVLKANYAKVLYELNEQIKLCFDANGIEIPFPQISAHLRYPAELKPRVTESVTTP